MRVRILPAKSRSLLDLRAFLIPAYALDVLGFFIGFIGLYMPFFYAQVYAIETQIASENFAFYLLAIMNATSTFGRIIPNFIADLLGPFNVVIPFALITAVLCFSFIAISSSGGMIVLIAFYGFFSGAFVSLPPAIIVSLSQNERGKIGTRLGQSFACLAVGVLIGTPIGGAILGRTGSYEAVWAFAGSTLVVAAGLLMAARLSWRGWRLMVKA
jgi:predicted MFS family arabinose efflux permease